MPEPVFDWSNLQFSLRQQPVRYFGYSIHVIWSDISYDESIAFHVLQQDAMKVDEDKHIYNILFGLDIETYYPNAYRLPSSYWAMQVRS
jgi:hypothetical protein